MHHLAAAPPGLDQADPAQDVQVLDDGLASVPGSAATRYEKRADSSTATTRPRKAPSRSSS
ncbi:hypothetical protein [Nocardiopsis sp. RV163]|uniref:hypothetical protein n=1 Tax=Nocardiopsis sp. RV163 TaxID=1661388 RepID=UPI00064BECC7|nr:hypothetical protein [Nocardiopsis sp. RV163]